MKVIDILNKIANGEEAPKKIKLNEIIFEYQGDDYLFIDKDNTNYWLFSEPYSDKFEYLENFLRAEIEIIEEDKKIEKLDLILDEHFSNDELQAYIKETQKKVNEIIDKINEE